MRVQEADVLVHVEDVAVGEALDVLVDGHNLLQVLVLARTEDGVVDYYAVDLWVGIGVEDGVFEFFAIDFSELEIEATMRLLVPYSFL
jgi:aromatic ring-cleaving dioxygenase